MNFTIALFTHCQDSFGSELSVLLKEHSLAFIYPSTHDVDAAIAKLQRRNATVAIIDTASISKEMAEDIINAIKETGTDTLLFTHSGDPIPGIHHVINNEELVSIILNKDKS